MALPACFRAAQCLWCSVVPGGDRSKTHKDLGSVKMLEGLMEGYTHLLSSVLSKAHKL